MAHLLAAEVEQRLDRIEKMLALQVNPNTIERTMAAEWNCTSRNVRKYITRAWKRIQACQDKALPFRRYQLRRSLELVFTESLKTRNVKREKGEVEIPPDLRSANQALVSLAKLDGLFAPDQHLHIEGSAASLDDHYGTSVVCTDPSAARAYLAEFAGLALAAPAEAQAIEATVVPASEVPGNGHNGSNGHGGNGAG